MEPVQLAQARYGIFELLAELTSPILYDLSPYLHFLL